MKEIICTNGIITIVDDEDYNWLIELKWYAKKDKGKNTYYVVRYTSRKTGHKRISMHEVIFGNKYPDHKDRNGLNNQRSNLRKATKSQNAINRVRTNLSGYRGVCFHKKAGKFIAQININSKRKWLGTFDTAIEAARKYDRYAKKYHGEFAILNNIID